MIKMIKTLSLLLAFVLLASCTMRTEASIDPYEGMIQVNDGTGMVWIPIIEQLQPNMLKKEDFTTDGNTVTYSGQFRRGIDVSEHQLEIDWRQVASSVLADFAFIRAGYRGYTEGQIYEDAWYRQNMDGAAENGIDVGVYFFSQAITPEEAVEEANFLLELIGGYDIACPVVYDWEPMHIAGARTEGLSREILTECAVAFCETIKAAGYEPMVYIYRYLGYHSYDLAALKDYQLWVGSPGEYPDFYYAHNWWQYSYTGSVPGIEGETDLNLYFPTLPQPPAEEAEE